MRVELESRSRLECSEEDLHLMSSPTQQRAEQPTPHESNRPHSVTDTHPESVAEMASGSEDIPVLETKGKKRKKSRHLERGGDSSRWLRVAEPQSSAQSAMKAEEQFTPERVELEEDEDDGGSKPHGYRFVCRRAGRFQCTSTSLVFVMEGEGQISYSIVDWDRQILGGLGQMTPAGPLYRINCSNKSIKEVHFPHCEIYSEETEPSLSVAHVARGNVEVLDPLALTETHVAVKISELSLFGLLRHMIYCFFSVRVNLSFSLQSHTEEQNILHVFLLPSSVPESQVKEQYPEHALIDFRSECDLTPGTQYSLRSDTPDTRVFPKTVSFECDFGPDYYSTFRVVVKTNVTEVQLGLWDENGKEAWEPRPIFLPVSDPRPTIRSSKETPDDPRSYIITPTDPEFRRRLLSENRIYMPMEMSRRRRSALLITNSHFSDERNNRHGAERREEMMDWLLTALGYSVTKYRDLTGDAMKQAVESFAEGSNHQQSDGTFVVIMSHGLRIKNLDAVIGVNYHPESNSTDVFFIDEIFSSLCAEKCPELRDKPKIIIIDASIGGEFGGEKMRADWLNVKLGPWKGREIDFVLFMCSPHSRTRTRPLHGSVFIKSLVDVFCRSAHDTGIMDLFTEVHSQMETYPNFRGEYVPCIEFACISKELYLFPGF